MAAPRLRLHTLSRLALCGALLTVLGGGSFHCTWSSGNDDDDDNGDDDDLEPNEVVLDSAGAPGLASDLLSRLPFLEPAFVSPLPPLTVSLPGYVPEDYRMTAWDVTPGGWGEAEARHVTVALGPSVSEAFGPGSYGAAELAEFADRVRRAHPELLALAPGDGELHLQGTAFVDDLVLVRWAQTFPGQTADDAADAMHHLTIVLDAMGRLVHVDNAVATSGG